MNRPALHLTRPGQLPGPATGHDSLQVLTNATTAATTARRYRTKP